MTPVQWGITLAALAASFLVGDLLRARDWPTWPHAAAVLVMAVLGGWFGQVWLVAAMLGAGVGWVLVGTVDHVQARRVRRQLSRRDDEDALAVLRRRDGAPRV